MVSVTSVILGMEGHMDAIHDTHEKHSQVGNGVYSGKNTSYITSATSSYMTNV